MLKEWVNNQGYISRSYIVRPGSVGVDFDKTDFLQTGTWRGLDISHIVPANAKAVNINVWGMNAMTNKYFALKMFGETNVWAVSDLYIVVANRLHSQNMVVGHSDTGIITYWADLLGWMEIWMQILGWWI